MSAMITGVLFLLFGVLGLYLVSRRQFYRRNVAGVEEFSSHSAMIGAQLLEKVIRIASWLLVVFGIIAVIAAYSRPA